MTTDDWHRDKKFELLTKEYDTLRAEVLQTIQSRNQVLALGVAGLGIGFGGAAVHGGASYGFWGLAVLLPLLVAGVYGLWCSEYLRMVRASQHLTMLERALNSMVSGKRPRFLPEGLSWETYLRPHMRTGRSVARGDDPGDWKGAQLIDLHAPLSAFLLVLTIGLALLGCFGPGMSRPPVAWWHYALATCGPILFLVQLAFFFQAKKRYSATVEVVRVYDAVKDSHQMFCRP
jgi:hypothetical protein